MICKLFQKIESLNYGKNVEIFLYWTILISLFLLWIFICLSFHARLPIINKHIRNKHISIIKTLTTYCYFCMIMEVVVNLCFHVFSFKPLWQHKYNSGKFGIKLIHYIILVIFISLSVLTGYSLFLIVIGNKLNRDWVS